MAIWVHLTGGSDGRFGTSLGAAGATAGGALVQGPALPPRELRRGLQRGQGLPRGPKVRGVWGGACGAKMVDVGLVVLWWSSFKRPKGKGSRCASCVRGLAFFGLHQSILAGAKDGDKLQAARLRQLLRQDHVRHWWANESPSFVADAWVAGSKGGVASRAAKGCCIFCAGKSLKGKIYGSLGWWSAGRPIDPSKGQHRRSHVVPRPTRFAVCPFCRVLHSCVRVNTRGTSGEGRGFRCRGALLQLHAHSPTGPLV